MGSVGSDAPLPLSQAGPLPSQALGGCGFVTGGGGSRECGRRRLRQMGKSGRRPHVAASSPPIAAREQVMACWLDGT